MLTVQKVTGGTASPYAEYLISRTQGADGRGDYYLNSHGRQEAPGRWAIGALARQLLDIDSDQPVSEQQLRNLLNVGHPNDPSKALRPNGSSGTATAAIDLTFSAPKSVSVAWALGSEDARRAIEQAHEHAIDDALAHAVKHVPMVRRRVDRTTVLRERPAELIASVYRHTTARAVDDRPPDPQLHSHVLLHGAIRAPVDLPDPAAGVPQPAIVAAIESRAVMVHQRELGATYRAALADLLRDLGYAIDRNTGRDGRYFEIRGVPRSVIEWFSSRHRQVRERIEWRKLERLQGLRRLAKLDGARGQEAQARLLGVESDLIALARREDGRDGVLAVRPDVSAAEYELLERRDGLLDLSRRFDAIGDVARARLEEVERWGDRLTPAQERVAAIESRAPKGLETHGDLDREWGSAAGALGLDARDAERLTEQGPEKSPERAELLRATLGNLTARHATFVPREARAIVLETAASVRQAEGVLAELAERGQIIRLEQGRSTTSAHRELERRVLDQAARLASGRVQPVAAEIVNSELESLNAQFAPGGLAAEQETAVRTATSDRQLVFIKGQAGTGKSTVLIAAARAETIADRQVVVTSTGGQAAERLARDLRAAGVPAEALSTRALEAACKVGSLRLGPDTTVIHEESALAATHEQRALMGACLLGGSRLIEVGDAEQSTPVGAGGLIGRVEQLAAEHDGFVSLEQIVRSRDEADRDMQKALRAGATDRVVASLVSRERLIVAATRAEAAQRAVELWETHRQHPDGALVICEGSNDHVDELNAQLQAVRQERGELGHQSVPVVGRPYSLHKGDEVVIRAQFHDTEHGTIRNGERGTVSSIDHDRAHLLLAEDRLVALNPDELHQADARLAYAQHAHPAQGATTGVAIDLFTALSTRRGQYVALTRARDAHHLVTSYEDLQIQQADGRDKALLTLAEQLGRDNPEIPSVDFAQLPSPARTAALRDVAELAGAPIAQDIATAQPRPDGPHHLADVSASELAERSAELRIALQGGGQRAGHERVANLRAERVKRLRDRLVASTRRLDALRAGPASQRTIRRRARREIALQISNQERAISEITKRLADLEHPPSDGAKPGARSPSLTQTAAEYVAVETELGNRDLEAHDRAWIEVQLMPSEDVIARLGPPPPHGTERELWMQEAFQIERDRTPDGELLAPGGDSIPAARRSVPRPSSLGGDPGDYFGIDL